MGVCVELNKNKSTHTHTHKLHYRGSSVPWGPAIYIYITVYNIVESVIYVLTMQRTFLNNDCCIQGSVENDLAKSVFYHFQNNDIHK